MLLNDIVDTYYTTSIPQYRKEAFKDEERIIEHPLDKDVIDLLTTIKTNLRDDDTDYQLYYYSEEIKEIWKIAIQKSIKCLRFFDTREPYMEYESKNPVAYGVEELSDYFEKYIKFESMLYGGGKYYRDHVIHVFRVWLLGLDTLLANEGEYLKRIHIQSNYSVNALEKISIWSMIALTHDLGYPLEKAQGIIDQTKDMMKSFISNPTMSMDLSFNGIQNNMNDFVVRFISSKMNKVPSIISVNEAADEKEFDDSSSGGTKTTNQYVARLQPKYYFKFQKSLEGYNHGILSTIILYKLLRYFLESDFNINEDYRFDEEESRQFYIRREILRTIASHTCHDIYHLDMLSFAFLLIVVDDAQEWGRKRISDLYVNKGVIYEFLGITPEFDCWDNEHSKGKIHNFEIKESFSFKQTKDLEDTLLNLYRQCRGYKEIFRDGQDTTRRDFTFTKHCEIVLDSMKRVQFQVDLLIPHDERPKFTVEISCNTATVLNDFSEDFLTKAFAEEDVDVRKIEDGSSKKKIKFEIIDKYE